MNPRRNIKKMNKYKEIYQYKCMDPNCISGVNVQTHHIIPLKHGGMDEQYNYILLCFKCHRFSNNHRYYYKKVIELTTWKYYFESLITYNQLQEISYHPENVITHCNNCGKPIPDNRLRFHAKYCSTHCTMEVSRDRKRSHATACKVL